MTSWRWSNPWHGLPFLTKPLHVATHSAHASQPKVLSLVGPTAVGKTSLSIRLAQLFGGEIVNADSRLVYRGMDIGTAKPSPQEQALVQHHIVDIIDPDERFSLSRYLDLARALMQGIPERGALPILAGGSGQYVWGLLEGWRVPEIPPDETLRSELEQVLEAEGLETLQRRLRTLDPDGAQRVEMLNPRRVIRAIERAHATGDATGGAGKADHPPYDALVLGLTAPRDVLHARVAERLDQMIECGWLTEVDGLINRGTDFDEPSMSAIGYRQVARHLRGELGFDEMREEIIIATNRLIGAQHNWFKPSDDRIKWIDVTSVDSFEVAKRMVSDWLSGNDLDIGEG